MPSDVGVDHGVISRLAPRETGHLVAGYRLARPVCVEKPPSCLSLSRLGA